MSTLNIKKNRYFNLSLIVLLSLGIGFYGLDTDYIRSSLSDEHMGDRSISSHQIERFINGYIHQYDLDPNHPEFKNIVNSLASEFKANWRNTTRIAMMLEQQGFEPSIQQIKAAIHADKLSEKELERLAANHGMSTIQLISQASDEWRRLAFAELLKQSEIMDPFSVQVAKAIEGQTREFSRYKINLPTPVITDAEIKTVYDNHKADYQFARTYDISYIELKGQNLIQVPNIKQSKDYFFEHPAQAPTGKTIQFMITDKKVASPLGKQDLKPLSQSERESIIKLMNQGFFVYDQEHPFEDGLLKHDTYYTFKKALPPTDHDYVSHYQQILVDQALEKTAQELKELAFTSTDLSLISKKFNTKIMTSNLSSAQINGHWPKAEVMNYLEGNDAASYSSPVLSTADQSLLVIKLVKVNPETPKNLAEATDEIKRMLIQKKQSNEQQLFALKLMQELGNGSLSKETQKQVTLSKLVIEYKNLNNYQFIEPIVNAFYLYQTKTDQFPSFLLNGSVAQIGSITYPKLDSKANTPPAYLAPSAAVLGALTS
jgi:hypothetical protein